MDDNQVKDGVGFETLNFVLFYIITLQIYIFQALLNEHEGVALVLIVCFHFITTHDLLTCFIMFAVRNLRWWKILMDLSMNNSQSCSFCQQPGIPHYLMTNYCKSVGTFSAYLKLWSSFFYLLFSSTSHQMTQWRPPYIETRTCDQCHGRKIHVAVQDGLRRSIFSPCSVFSIANTHHRLALP